MTLAINQMQLPEILSLLAALSKRCEELGRHHLSIKLTNLANDSAEALLQQTRKHVTLLITAGMREGDFVFYANGATTKRVRLVDLAEHRDDGLVMVKLSDEHSPTWVRGIDIRITDDSR